MPILAAPGVPSLSPEKGPGLLPPGRGDLTRAERLAALELRVGELYVAVVYLDRVIGGLVAAYAAMGDQLPGEIQPDESAESRTH